MQAAKRTINDIFNGNRILEIPFFQRAYVWDEPQWERLLEDMQNVTQMAKPYFLGSVILKQQPTDSDQQIGDRRTLIDGQQRLTTLNIFFKVLCLKNGEDHQFDRIFKLINGQLALWHNHNDLKDFEEILNLKEETQLEGKSQIIKAYEYFRENISPSQLKMITILNNIMFVGIDLSRDEDEQQIFDTINSLGVRLTTAELLKNYFFSREDTELYEKHWKSTFELNEDEREFWDTEITLGRSRRTNIDLFFYSFLLIKIQDKELNIRTEHKASFSRVDGLFDSYKQFIEIYHLDKEALILEIQTYAKIYRNNIRYDILDEELTQHSGIERINAIIFGLDNSTIIPYILYVLKEVHDEKARNDIFGYLESFLMRRIVSHLTTKNYNQLFSERLILNQVLSKDQLIQYIEGQKDTVNYFPDDSELQSGFHHSRLINRQTAGILYMIESKIRDRAKHSTALLGLHHYSLEHIMPKKWENHWGEVASEELRIQRNRKLLTLGNLTIITGSLNKSIRDASWIDKKHGKNGKMGLNHFASSLDTFSPYLDNEEWDEAQIEKRADFLFENAQSIWPNETISTIIGEGTL